jgi:hypothetical protein
MTCLESTPSGRSSENQSPCGHSARRAVDFASRRVRTREGGRVGNRDQFGTARELSGDEADPAMSEYSRAEFDKSWWIAEHIPRRLTDFDLLVLKSFSTEHAERARLLRVASPPLPPTSPPALPPIQIPEPAAGAAPGIDRKTLNKSFEAYTKAIVPVLKEAFEKQDAKLKSELDALRTRDMELETRILELEAVVTSLMVPNAER